MCVLKSVYISPNGKLLMVTLWQVPMKYFYSKTVHNTCNSSYQKSYSEVLHTTL